MKNHLIQKCLVEFYKEFNNNKIKSYKSVVKNIPIYFI